MLTTIPEVQGPKLDRFVKSQSKVLTVIETKQTHPKSIYSQEDFLLQECLCHLIPLRIQTVQNERGDLF